MAPSTAQRRVMTAIETCRTAVLGGHVEQCDACGHQRIAYNSCANRHCPKCQSLARAAWVEHRSGGGIFACEQYFHVVFTHPGRHCSHRPPKQSAGLRHPLSRDRRDLRTIAADPQHLGAEIGFFAVLHSWGQTLVHHPHLHCVVPGGGLSPDGARWVGCSPGFFLPVRVLSRLFRRLFLQHLENAFDDRPIAVLRRPRFLARARRLPALSGTATKGRVGGLLPSRPSPDPSRSSTTSAAIPTASPSPTIASSTSAMAPFVSAGRTIGTAVAKRS